MMIRAVGVAVGLWIGHRLYGRYADRVICWCIGHEPFVDFTYDGCSHPYAPKVTKVCWRCSRCLSIAPTFKEMKG